MIGSVSVYVCVRVSVCLPLFSDIEQSNDLVLDIIVEYGPETEPVDIGVNQCNFKIKGFINCVMGH